MIDSLVTRLGELLQLLVDIEPHPVLTDSFVHQFIGSIVKWLSPVAIYERSLGSFGHQLLVIVILYKSYVFGVRDLFLICKCE